MHDRPHAPSRPVRWTTRTYATLRKAAVACLAQERRRPTLAPTELLHDAWLKLHNSPAVEGAYEIGLAVHAMREALVDHARRRHAKKRDSGGAMQSLESCTADLDRDSYVVALDDALIELHAHDADLARLVELRFFGGLEIDAIASALGISARTVKRRWRYSKAWLHQRIVGT